VVIKQVDGAPHEPYEQVTVDADADAQGDIMSALGSRGAELKDMQQMARPDPLGLHGAVARFDRISNRISYMTAVPACCITSSITMGRWCSASWASVRTGC